MTNPPRATKAIRRVVVKVGSAVIDWPNRKPIRQIAAEIAGLKEGGLEPVIVSSGAIACGVQKLGLAGRPSDMATLQAAAAIGQRTLMDEYASHIEPRGILVAQVLLTQLDMVQRKNYVNARNTLEKLILLGAIPIINENDTVAIDEIRYGDNDLLASLVANLVNADLLIMLSDVEGVFTDNPSRPGATLISRFDDSSTDGARVRGRSRSGSGGMASKLEAARMATLSGVPVVIAAGSRKGVITAICNGEDLGTYFPAKRSRVQAKKLWIAWAPVARGAIKVDEGAVRAIAEDNKSLLAAGISLVEGTFRAGDAVNVMSLKGELVGKGIVTFDSGVLAGIAGTRAEREVIHRDQLVIF